VKANLKIIAAVNKIDMKNAQTKTVLKQIEDTFGLKKETTLQVCINETEYYEGKNKNENKN
jgi:translation elongation factor EF-4